MDWNDARATRIRRDFDRIAAIADDGWNHNDHYHRRIERLLPSDCGNALDLGCGTGRFTAVLAGRARRVTALDLSPAMIDRARTRLSGEANVHFEIADALHWSWPESTFDCIVSIAALHHLPLEDILPRLAGALKPGGTVVVLDLYRREAFYEWLLEAPAMVLSATLRLSHTGALRDSRAVRAAWAAHECYERMPGFRETAAAFSRWFEGVSVERLLLWRYVAAWKKPG